MPALRLPLAAAALVAACLAGATSLTVEVSTTRAADDIDALVQAKVKAFARTAAALTARTRARMGNWKTFSLPVKVVLTRNGIPLPAAPSGRAGGDLTLSFAASGSRAFSSSYQNLLQNTLDKARPAMNALYGQPKSGGAVKVLNYDADIQDRLAVSGGYYVANAPGGPEIRFPVFNSTVSASINFVHTLLLAYQGSAAYSADAWNEGFSRAATMAVARTAGSLPNNPTSDEVEATLDSLYDSSSTYDWNNQPGLGANPFIASNLLNIPLPIGGSTGGPYLLRYQMAGTAWAKVLAEHPGFIAEFNKRFYASPAAFTTEAQLVALGQTVLNFLTGSAAATVEGLSFANWVERQAILDAARQGGTKAIIQAFPIAPDAGTSDFGVFGFILHATKTQTNGDEVLLAGRSYPVYWRPDNFRFFISTQDDQVDIAGGFGSAAPNFPSTTFDGDIYRVVVDMPFGTQSPRVVVPAGAVATGQNTTGNNVYGTLSSYPDLTGAAFYRVRVQWTGGTQDIVVNNLAFGANITQDTFTKAQPLTVKVFKVDGTTVTEVSSRQVNKGQGAIGLDLRPASVDTVYNLNRALRLFLFGLPVQPYRPEASALLGTAAADTLVASWNSRTARYELWPEEGRLMGRLGWFHRSPSATARTIRGRLSTNMPVVASLQPGWNAVSSPSFSAYATTSVQVAPAADFFGTYAESIGTVLGTTMFRWVPDGTNPDTGTFQPVTNFPSGEGVFIKCLRSEGAALAFMPSGITPSRLSAQWSAPSTGWEARLTVTNPRGHKTWAQLGQMTGATKAADPRFDIEVPPSPGGLQARSRTTGATFRDIRAQSYQESWTVDVDGLTTGATYSLNLAFLQGWNSVILQDLTAGTYNRVSSYGLTTSFRAKAPRHTFQITVGVAR